MNDAAGSGRHRIGSWDFNPATGELRHDSELRRLEPRAARTLELLCEAKGEVVPHEQLIDRVWNGRAVSENSVAVAIGQLRRALDDDARDPKLIETIPKRGYRLVAGASAPSRPRNRARLLAIVLVVGLLVAGMGFGLRNAVARPGLAMSDIANQTGDRRYDPLARATTELMLAELSERGFDVERGGSGRMLITGKLVMWNGEPYLGLSATDPNGVVRWSAMTGGTSAAVPAGLSGKLDEFQRAVKP